MYPQPLNEHMIVLDYMYPSFMITDNFSSEEILQASHPNQGENFVVMDRRVIDVAQYIREQLGIPTEVTSAFRNLVYNASIGSNDSSQHPKGTALDLKAVGIVDFMLKAKNEQNEHWHNMIALGLGGFGVYDWGVHIDVRNAMNIAFWDNRKKKV